MAVEDKAAITRIFPNIILLKKRKETLEGFGIRFLLIVLSVVIAFAIGSLFFIPFGVNPLDAYKTLLTEGFGDFQGVAFTLIQASPLLLVGLGTVIAFKSGFRFLGFEGTMNIGAIVGVWIALRCQEGDLIGPLPQILFFPLAFILCFIVAGLWASIMGYSKAKLGGNEVIVSLMSNYVAILIVQFLVAGPMRQPGDQPQTPRIPEYTRLPYVIPGTRAHAGIIVALVLMIVVYYFLKKTSPGYKLIITGENKRAAKYAGVNVARTIIIASFIAGGLGGVAGGFEVLGVHQRVVEGITSDMGRLGIVSALLADLNPLGASVMSFFYAGIGVGADAMQRRMGVPTPVVFTIQTLVVLVMLVIDMLRVYQIVLPWRDRKKKVRL